MSSVTVRPIRGEDFAPALALWNETRPYDPITARFFKRKIFLDVCFDPDGYLLAEDENGLCGYVYVVRRLRPQDNDNSPMPNEGWINGFGYLPTAKPTVLGRRIHPFRGNFRRIARIIFQRFYFQRSLLAVDYQMPS